MYIVCIARATVCQYIIKYYRRKLEYLAMFGGSSLVTIVYIMKGIRCLMCCYTVLREISHLQEKTIIRD